MEDWRWGDDEASHNQEVQEVSKLQISLYHLSDFYHFLHKKVEKGTILCFLKFDGFRHRAVQKSKFWPRDTLFRLKTALKSKRLVRF